MDSVLVCSISLPTSWVQHADLESLVSSYTIIYTFLFLSGTLNAGSDFKKARFD